MEEIVVTAQKRSQVISKVPMSITAVTGTQLLKQGITSTADLAKIVPGFQYSQSLFGEPVYTLRGIGFYDTSVGARPAVTVYVDQVPLPFSVMSNFGAFDLERVEVLKGPQGTIFGQNSTGGAINYIAAKPTSTRHAGFDVSVGNYSDVEATGYVSGPLTDTLSGRLALQTSQAGNWQKSYTTGDTLGQKNRTNVRLSLLWTPSDVLSFDFNLTTGYNDSDTPAAQKIGYAPNIPQVPLPSVENYPNAPANNRAADFTPGFNYQHHERFYQGSLHGRLDLGGGTQLDSLTSFGHWQDRYRIDIDGETINNVAGDISGQINTFNQELRLSGKAQKLRWLVGANYEHDSTRENDFESNPISTITPTFEALNGGLPFLGNPYFTYAKYDTYAAFANLDYDITDRLTAHGGVRYTQANSSGEGASLDSANGGLGLGLSNIFNLTRAVLGLPPVPYVPGGYATGNANFVPALARHSLNENNASWRTGLDWRPFDGTLLYGNISKGYKAGSYPVLEATLARQLKPVKQESVLAYEVGFKSTFLQNRLRATGAVFYYDYSDKQFIGRINIPPLGSQQTILNVPKSRVQGGELQLTWRPVEAFTTTLGATYLDTRIGNFKNYNGLSQPADLTGEAFPYAPKFQITWDAEYDMPLTERLNGFVGVSGHFQSPTSGAFGDNAILSIGQYATVDFRGGVETENGTWRLSLFGRNVTNQYYWTNAQKALDTVIRYAGMPTTYGAELSYKY